MANISVAELLHDPDFVDACTVQRQSQTVGNDGRAVMTTTAIPILASIQASGGDHLALLSDMARTSSSYDVITTFALAVATDETAADIIDWQGDLYTVTSVARFGNFANGTGHYEGMMEFKPMVRRTA